MAENISDTLSPKQEGTILALLSEHSVVKAAERAGVGVRTIYRWLDEPDFSRAYRKARRESFSQAIVLIQRYAGLAAHTLPKVMTDQNAPYTAKVQASIAVLRFGREGIELEDLAARVDALERSALHANRSLPPAQLDRGDPHRHARAQRQLKGRHTMNLATRLRRLETTIGSGVCRSCGRVPGTERWPDGTVAPVKIQTAGPNGDPASLPPTMCPECGALLAITIVYQLPPMPEEEP